MRASGRLTRLCVCLVVFAVGLGAQESFKVETGEASWYGADFHGRKTASGEIYDMNAMTAAHRTLPFGTLVLVTNLSDGRQVVVRVNDRGPFAKDRIIDLSAAAARVIGLDRTGTARVEIRPAPIGAVAGAYPTTSAVGSAAAPHAAFKVPGPGSVAMRVQVGSYRDAANAAAAVESLARLGLSAVTERVGANHHVVMYVSESDLARLLAILDSGGWKERLIKKVRR